MKLHVIETTGEQTAERHDELEREYNDISVASTTSNTALLPPSVPNPIEGKKEFSYAPSVISHVEQQCIISSKVHVEWARPGMTCIQTK